MLYHSALPTKYPLLLTYVVLTTTLHAHPHPQKYTVCYYMGIRHMETLLNSEHHENFPAPKHEDSFLVTDYAVFLNQNPRSVFTFTYCFREDPSTTW